MIAGCVVIYNPEDTLVSNILSYYDQLYEIFVIDNSTKGNDKVYKKLLNYNKITYINNNGNQGIANALNVGASEAMKKGYKWLLTMDQDSSFINTKFFKIVLLNTDNQIAIYAASYTNKYDQWVKDYSESFKEVQYAITSGNLLRLEAWQKCGKFEEKLFIDEVDHDLCLKLRKLNFKILTSKSIFLSHSIGEQTPQESVKKLKSIHQPIRYYYISRNGLYVVKKFFFSDTSFALKRLKYLVKAFIKILFIYPDKRKYLSFFIKGINDFIFSKYGKYL